MDFSNRYGLSPGMNSPAPWVPPTLSAMLHKLRPKSIIFGERNDPEYCTPRGCEELKILALHNRFSDLSAFEQRMCLVVACATIGRYERQQGISTHQLNKDYCFSKKDMASFSELDLHDRDIQRESNQPVILEDDIRTEMIARRNDYLLRVQQAMMRPPTEEEEEVMNESEDGACSDPNSHQSDDDKIKEKLEKKATEERFPDFVW